MALVLGIDVGSGYCKAVVLEEKTIRSSAVLLSGGGYKTTAENVAQEALAQVNLSLADVTYTVSTGYGAAAVDFASFSARTFHAMPQGFIISFRR